MINSNYKLSYIYEACDYRSIDILYRSTVPN